MARIESFRDRIVWQRAMDLAVEIYRLARLLLRDETYRLVNQMTRAAASIPANIAEGNARGTARDYAQFLAIAKGSLTELETYLILTMRISYLTEQQTQTAVELVNQIGKMLTSLRRRVMETSL